MNSTRPYLVRAFYEWIVDNECTPYIVVNAGMDHVEVPQEYVENGQIVLNVSMSAVQNLDLHNDAVSFQARFGGLVKQVYVPMAAVMAIYAKENGRGMVFAEEEDTPPPHETDGDDNISDISSGTGGTGKKSGKRRSHLTVVK